MDGGVDISFFRGALKRIRENIYKLHWECFGTKASMSRDAIQIKGWQAAHQHASR